MCPFFTAGRTDPEFNLRHDWNSLLDAEANVAPVTNRSTARWPPADVLLQYLKDYAAEQEAAGRIAYRSNVIAIGPHPLSDAESDSTSSHTDSASDSEQKPHDDSTMHTCRLSRRFKLTVAQSVVESDDNMRNHDGNVKLMNISVGCGVVIMATGLGDPNTPTGSVDGVEHAMLYRDQPRTGESFEGLSVAVLGGGNAAFETADALAPYVAYVHLWKGRAPKARQPRSSFVSWES